MPVGGKVDTAIKKLMAKGYSKASAIAILKAKGVLKQKGSHLEATHKTRKSRK